LRATIGSVLRHQRADLVADGAQRAVLDLDELAVGDGVDAVLPQRHLQGRLVAGVQPLELAVE